MTRRMLPERVDEIKTWLGPWVAVEAADAIPDILADLEELIGAFNFERAMCFVLANNVWEDGTPEERMRWAEEKAGGK